AAFHRGSAQGLHVFQITLGVGLARERKRHQNGERHSKAVAQLAARIHSNELTRHLYRRNRRCKTAYRRDEAAVIPRLHEENRLHRSPCTEGVCSTGSTRIGGAVPVPNLVRAGSLVS